MQAPADLPEPTSKAPALKVVRSGKFDWKMFVRERWRALSVIATLVLGMLFVLLGWYGAAHTNILTEQIPYLISGGLLGLGLIIVSGFMAYSFRMEEQSEALRHEIARALSLPRGGGAGDLPTARGIAAEVFTVPGGHSFHLAGCPIIEGKDGVASESPARAIAKGLATCRLCGTD